MKYLVIGLGIYGSNLAIDLTDMGHEVVGVDVKESNVEAIKDRISTAYILDASDEQSLTVLPINNVDAVIVAIGENFGASVKTVALLKKMGVVHIFARAIDTLHQSILEGLEVERILTPEQRAASDLVKELELGSKVQTLSICDDTYVLRFTAPDCFVDMDYAEIDMERRFKLQLIMATRRENVKNMLGLNYNREYVIDLNNQELKVKKGDTFTCCGTVKAFRSMMKSVSQL